MCFKLTCQHLKVLSFNHLLCYAHSSSTALHGLPIAYVTWFSLLIALSHYLHYCTRNLPDRQAKTPTSGCIILSIQRTINKLVSDWSYLAISPRQGFVNEMETPTVYTVTNPIKLMEVVYLVRKSVSGTGSNFFPIAPMMGSGRHLVRRSTQT